jgi:DNA adenine methylase
MTIHSKPFLKWVGGKTRLLPKLMPLLQCEQPLPGSGGGGEGKGGRLIEPFVGAGSVFLAADFPSYVINYANPDLAAAWVALQARPKEFMARAAQYFSAEYHSNEAYQQVRREFNSEIDRFERAVRLVYLNKFGFNGIYRVNRSGQFNIPYGYPQTLPTFPLVQMQAAAAKLQRCTVLGGGFRAAMELAGPGDVVYCDPPYLDSQSGKSYTGYTASGFDLTDHQALVAAAVQAHKEGATVLVSNHYTPLARVLYSGWELHELQAWRSVSPNAQSRGNANELVAILAKA